MFLQKVRRTSTLGTSTQSYSNTNQTGNSPVVQVEPGADTTKLDPTLTPTPNNPDTLTPPIQPAPTQPGLLLPVGGFFGTVYVVLTKPTPNAAVVVVEVTNDSMDYNPSVDTNMLDDPTPPPQPPSPEPLKPYFSQTYYEETIATLRFQLEYLISLDCLLAYEPTPPHILDKIITILEPAVRSSSLMYLDESGREVAMSDSHLNTDTCFFAGSVLIPPGYMKPFSYDITVPGGDTPDLFATIDVGTFEIIDPRVPAYHALPQINLRELLFTDIFKGTAVIVHRAYVDDTTSILTVIRFGADVTLSSFANICIPILDTDINHVDWGTFEVEKVETVTLTDEPDPEEPTKPPKLPVKRAYVNIGGKLVYLYSTKKETETTVFVNYDGSNYGVIVTTPDRTATIKTGKSKPTASFTNNINSYSLNTAQQALLQTCLPIPDDTLQGGFKVMASNGTTELNFKSYGFDSIFYRTPTVYNQTTIKGCAVYGL